MGGGSRPYPMTATITGIRCSLLLGFNEEKKAQEQRFLLNWAWSASLGGLAMAGLFRVFVQAGLDSSSSATVSLSRRTILDVMLDANLKNLGSGLPEVGRTEFDRSLYHEEIFNSKCI